MQLYVARQPIFDAAERVVGYELLHRGGRTNRYVGTDATTATDHLLADHLLTDTWEQLTSGLPAWVNFPANALVSGSALLVPPDRIVIELLEDIVADPSVVGACRELRDAGYTLAADDVVDVDDPSPLLDLADIVKVDVRHTSSAMREALAVRFDDRRLLAEKVETRAEQAEALGLGYELLQGYFLREPDVITQRTIDRTRLGVLAAIAAVSREPMDFDEVEAALKRDVALIDRLLRYLNSVWFGGRAPVTTIKDALVRLGERQVRRWTTLNALLAVSTHTPGELIVSTLLRAQMSERLGAQPSVDASPLDLFLAGLYSQLHLLIGADFEATVRQAPVPTVVQRALIERDGPLWSTVELVVLWEAGEWDEALAIAERLQLDPAVVAVCYADAIGQVEAWGSGIRARAARRR